MSGINGSIPVYTDFCVLFLKKYSLSFEYSDKSLPGISNELINKKAY